jgi:hypothetical protein
VVANREEGLTALTPKRAEDVLNWPRTQVPARARNPPTRDAREARSFEANGLPRGASFVLDRLAYAASGTARQRCASWRA